MGKNIKNEIKEKLQNIDAEQNNILEKWKEIGITANNALESQALLQLYKK